MAQVEPPGDGDRHVTEPRADVRLGLGQASSPVAVVLVYGEHDHETRSILERALAPLQSHVLVDLSSCPFLDTSVVRVMLAKSAELERHGHRLELVVPPTHDHLARMFDLLGIRSVVPVLDELPALE